MSKQESLLKRLRMAASGLMVAFTMFATPGGLLLPIAAHASAKPANNGTLKIHEEGTASGTESNDPKVCAFNLEGFGFDAGQSGYVMIDVQGGDGPTGVSSGPYAFGPANDSGYGITPTDGSYFNDGGPTIVNGHYEATLYGKDDNGQINLDDEKAKSKVFKVECTPVIVEGTGTLTVQKIVSGAPEGVTSADFQMHVMQDGSDISGSPQAGSADPGNNYSDLSAGIYDVSETVTDGSDVSLDDYTTTFSDSCPQGVVTLTAESNVTCTVTNTFNSEETHTGSLTVIKHVEGGEASASDFDIHVKRGNGDSPAEDVDNSPQPGSETGTTYDDLNPGNYFVSEDGNTSDYTLSYSGDCDSSGKVQVAQDETATCTLTNTFIGGQGGVPTPTISTQVSKTSVTMGQQVTDTATLTGTEEGGPVNGTVTFFLCGPSGSNPDCSTGGTQVGDPVTITDGQAMSSAFTTAAAGRYCFRADYTPDEESNYGATSHTNLTTECFTVSAPIEVLGASTGPGKGGVTVLPQTGASDTWAYLVALFGAFSMYYVSRRRQLAAAAQK